MDEKNIKHNEFLALAKRVITDEFAKVGIEVKRIVLFGSRARGDVKEGSDWDFLAIVPDAIPHAIKVSVVLSIQRYFGKMLVPVDIMVKSLDRIEVERNDAGFMTRTALSEGVPI